MRHKTIKEEKYEVIYQAYVDAIYKVCLYYVRDEAEAQEITLQVFRKFYDYFEDVESEYMFGYLVHITKEMINNRNKD